MCHRGTISRLVCFALLFAIALHGRALEPEQVFEKASPSVVTVQTLDATGSIIGFGSGVVIAPGEVITNCHVVEGGVRLRASKGSHTSPAYVRFYDKTRDLCQLHATQAASFTRPVRGVVAMDDLRVGQRVYAIGGPRGLEVTLSDGLISGLRQNESGSLQVIQTTAPISPGSSGGGLFDQDGRLVGITTFLLEGSQNLNFALPASWVLELSSRQADLSEHQRRLKAAESAQRREELLRLEELERREKAQVLAQQKGEAQEFQARAAAEAVAAKQRQVAEFAERISKRIRSRLVLPPGLNGNPEAVYSVTLLPGGEVVEVKLVKSSGVPAYDTAVQDAIYAANPFPVPSDPDLFEKFRQANYRFRPLE